MLTVVCVIRFRDLEKGEKKSGQVFMFTFLEAAKLPSVVIAEKHSSSLLFM